MIENPIDSEFRTLFFRTCIIGSGKLLEIDQANRAIRNNDRPRSNHAITRILIYGMGGNDKIVMKSDVPLPAWMFGGDGNDSISGGAKDDLAAGLAGNDLLVGNDGRDFIAGGTGGEVASDNVGRTRS